MWAESTYGCAKIFEKCSQDAARFYEINPLFRLARLHTLRFLEDAAFVVLAIFGAHFLQFRLVNRTWFNIPDLLCIVMDRFVG